MLSRIFLAVSISWASLACSAGTQKPAISAVLKDPNTRRESLEATLRVLDEHPEYVDDLFVAALRHPRTMDRFLTNAARELERDEFARFTAKRLNSAPKGLHRVLVASLDEASDEPEVLGAISEAMGERPQLAAIVVVQRDATLRRILHALLLEVLKNPEARRSFLAALSENSEPLARIVSPNPQVLRALIKAFVEVRLAKGEKEIAALLKALE